MQKFISIVVLALFSAGSALSQTFGTETVLLETPYGNMKLKLYEETPLHKANFLKLVKDHFYDSLLFHRVIDEFMIQGGDPLSKHAKPGDSLGHGDAGYTVPAEIRTNLIHKKGALCAARESDDINPKFESSATQFYIVMGRKRTMEDLKKYETRINTTRYNNCARTFIRSAEGVAMKQHYNRLKKENQADSAALINSAIEARIRSDYEKSPEYHFSQLQIEEYTTRGGTPHLDGTYTVFGEVIEGVDVIDRIASAKKDPRDRPLRDLRMKMSILK